MADIATIKVTEELRPAMCKVFTKPKQAEWVRCLVHVTKHGTHGGFVCEDEYGMLHEAFDEGLKFLDSAGRFEEICWEVGA